MLLVLFGDESDMSWRILLGVGCLPGIILTIARVTKKKNKRQVENLNYYDGSVVEEGQGGLPDTYQMSINKTTQSSNGQAEERTTSIIDAIRTEKALFRKLLGTAGCWLLFDVLFYGNTLFQPMVLSAVFGSAETVAATARDSSIIALLALPGYFIRYVTHPKYLYQFFDGILRSLSPSSYYFACIVSVL